MKKLISTILFLAFILALAGCGRAETPESASVEGAKPDGQTAPAALYELHRRSITNGSMSANSKGFYKCQSFGINDNYLITYTDFDTLSEVPLCTLEGCAHGDAECEARKRPEDDMLFAGETKLFWLNSELVGEDWATRAKVYVSELDGSNKRLFFETQDDDEMNMTRLFCDDQSFYYIQTELVDVERDYDFGLIKVNLETGEREELLRRDPSIDYWQLVGQLGDNLLVQTSNGSVASTDDGRPATIEHSLISVPTRGGEARKLGDWAETISETIAADRNSSSTSLGFNFISDNISGGILYSISDDDESLVAFDLTSWNISRLHTKPDVFNVGFSIDGVWDGRLLLSGYNNDKERVVYAYNLSDNALRELTQTYYRNGVDRIPITPYAETQTEFLVPFNERFIDVYSIYEGAPATESINVTQFAMIAKTDYWSNIQNYRDITEVL